MSIYSVSQVTGYIRQLLEADGFLADLYVTGEVSNLSKAASGHHYFTLKDAESQLRCVMFRNGHGAEFLAHGALVTIHGKAGVYQPRGELQIVGDLVQPEGVGELHMRFLQLKAKLETEGLFDPTRKRPLPKFPKRVAVITSRTGAVWHDIQNVVRRRYPLVELVLVHTPVQGDQAPPGVVSALKTANQVSDIDVIIVARGGGSLEELWAFNEEVVARAIHASRIPVVSAIGHETDTTIADFVADVRAPTPSAAAELVVPDRLALKRRVAELQEASRGLMTEQVRESRDQLRNSLTRLDHRAPDIVPLRQRIDELLRAAAAVIARDLAVSREQVNSKSLQLSAMHPVNTLSRGYALVERTRDGRLVQRTSDVQPGEALGIQIADGKLDAQVVGTPTVVPQVKPAPPRIKRLKAPTEQMPLFR